MSDHRRRHRTSAVAVGAALVFVLAVVPIVTAANSVPASRATDVSRAITPNDLKPAACASITVTNIVVGSNGTGQNDLVLGSALADNLNGRSGDDCIVGGGGVDHLTGARDYDICIGGPEPDVMNRSCEVTVD